MASHKRPVIKDLSDLKVTLVHKASGDFEYVEWFHFTADDEAHMGMSYKHSDDMTLDEFAAGLVLLNDKNIYPEVPAAGVTIAPESTDKATVYVKHSGFRQYRPPQQLLDQGFEADEPGGGEGDAKDQMLEEVLIMEMLSRTAHPYMVHYLGCRIRRGRITAIVLEHLDLSLFDYATNRPGAFAQLNKEAFLAGVESAVEFLHSLGLAHNDINPHNIMVRESQHDGGHVSPVLIDFDSCAALGGRLLRAGTRGFMDMDEDDTERFVSRKRHDDFALDRLREWWDKQLEGELEADEN